MKGDTVVFGKVCAVCASEVVHFVFLVGFRLSAFFADPTRFRALPVSYSAGGSIAKRSCSGSFCK